MPKKTVLELTKVKKSYTQGAGALKVLSDVSLKLKAGEVVAIVGPSGCGKSTLLQIAGLLDVPTGGSLSINGEDVTKASDAQRTEIRRAELGFVYQYHHLLAEFNAVENVAMPLTIAGVAKDEAHARAEALLKSLGLGKRLTHRPGQLSGGEQQRAAIARALVHKPSILLTDEPTGNLDPETADTVYDVLISQVKEQGAAMMMVTHNLTLAKRADRILALDKGKLAKS